MTTNFHSDRPRAHAHHPIIELLRLSICWLLAAFIAACGGGGGDDSATTEMTFAAQPADVSVVEGGTATLTVVLTGDADLQWQRLQPTGWVNLSGAQSPRLTLASVQASDSGAQFRVVATSRQNPARQIVSSVVTLTVEATAVAPAIAVQPMDVSSVDGQEVSFSITATGTNLSYRWQRSHAGGEWADIAGATSPILTLRVTLADDLAAFRVVVSNGSGSVTSAFARLGVGAAGAPSFVISPIDTTTVAGQSATFHASAVGAPTPTVRWQSSADSTAWVDVTGATGNSFTIPSTAASDDGKFVRAVATNQRGDVFSAAARLVVQTPVAPAIQAHPQEVSVGPGMQANFTVQASGVPSVAYQWQVSVDGGTSFTNVNGATSATLSVGPVISGDHGKRFRVVVTNSVGPVISAAVQLSVVQPPFITLQPTSATWRPGQLDALFVAAASGSDMRFQWQLSSDRGASWTNAPGATGTSYLHAANASASVNAVRVVVGNPGGSTVSQQASLEALRWQIVQPRPTGASLTGAVWRDASTVFATGAGGTILRSTDAGANWSVVSEGSFGSVDFMGIAFDANGIGITTSDTGSGNLPIRRSVDGGLHWVQVAMPATNGLFAAAASPTGTFCLAGNNGVILRSTDAGLTWRPATSDAGSAALWSMAFNADGVGVTVGDNGAILRSINGGANWSRVGSATAHLRAVAFATRDIVFAGGFDGTLLRSSDAGLTWQVAASGTSQGIQGIHFGSSSTGALALSQGGVRVTHNGGSSWSAANLSPNYATLMAVSFGPTGNAVAVGEYGSIFRSADSGLNWSTVALGGLEKSLFAVAFSTPSNGVAVGTGGNMLRSTDAGLTWTNIPTGTTTQRGAVGFFDATTGVALGVDGSIIRTTDGGASWTPATSGTATWLSAFARVDTTTGVAAADSGLLRTTDAGASWTPVSNAGLQVRALAFNDGQTGLAVGDGGTIRRSQDGGLTWLPVASGTSKGLFAVTFASATVAVAVGADGAVLRSTDAGATWQVGQFPRYSDYWFYGVAFTSSTTGVAVGNYGTVMITRDGGATWSDDYTQRLGGMQAVARVGAKGVVTVGFGGVITLNTAP